MRNPCHRLNGWRRMAAAAMIAALSAATALAQVNPPPVGAPLLPPLDERLAGLFHPDGEENWTLTISGQRYGNEFAYSGNLVVDGGAYSWVPPIPEWGTNPADPYRDYRMVRVYSEPAILSAIVNADGLGDGPKLIECELGIAPLDAARGRVDGAGGSDLIAWATDLEKRAGLPPGSVEVSVTRRILRSPSAIVIHGERIPIEQMNSVLVNRFGLTPEHAEGFLRLTSQQLRSALREAAERKIAAYFGSWAPRVTGLLDASADGESFHRELVALLNGPGAPGLPVGWGKADSLDLFTCGNGETRSEVEITLDAEFEVKLFGSGVKITAGVTLRGAPEEYEEMRQKAQQILEEIGEGAKEAARRWFEELRQMIQDLWEQFKSSLWRSLFFYPPSP